MGVDWGEYLGTEDPREIIDILDEECMMAAAQQNWELDQEDKEQFIRCLEEYHKQYQVVRDTHDIRAQFRDPLTKYIVALYELKAEYGDAIYNFAAEAFIYKCISVTEANGINNDFSKIGFTNLKYEDMPDKMVENIKRRVFLKPGQLYHRLVPENISELSLEEVQKIVNYIVKVATGDVIREETVSEEDVNGYKSALLKVRDMVIDNVEDGETVKFVLGGRSDEEYYDCQYTLRSEKNKQFLEEIERVKKNSRYDNSCSGFMDEAPWLDAGDIPF